MKEKGSCPDECGDTVRLQRAVLCEVGWASWWGANVQHQRGFLLDGWSLYEGWPINHVHIDITVRSKKIKEWVIEMLSCGLICLIWWRNFTETQGGGGAEWADLSLTLLLPLGSIWPHSMFNVVVLSGQFDPRLFFTVSNIYEISTFLYI